MTGIHVSLSAEAIKRILRSALWLNYYLLSRVGGAVLLVFGPFPASTVVKVIAVALASINMLPTVVAAYLLSIAAGLNQSKASALVLFAIILDIVAFLTTKQAYIDATGRRPGKFKKLPDLLSRWFSLLCWGVGMRALLLWQFFFGTTLDLDHNHALLAFIGFVFVPATTCADALHLTGDAIVLARAIALVVGGMLDVSVYLELQNMRFDRLQRQLDLEWERGLPPSDRPLPS